MMVSQEQLQRGITRFVDAEVLPKLSGIKKVGVGMYVGLVAHNAADAINKLKTNPAIAMLGIIDENNAIDIDALYDVAIPLFSEKQTFDLPVLGSVAFDKSDVDKLYKYIKG